MSVVARLVDPQSARVRNLSVDRGPKPRRHPGVSPARLGLHHTSPRARVPALEARLLTLLLAQAALAQDPAPETLVVTGTRVEQPVVAVPRALTVITDDDVADQQARTLPEALEQAPGVFLQRTNRGSGSPFLRGLTGPQNLVVIDGVPHNLAVYRTGPNQYLNLLDPTGATRIEVVRGPSSVLYGNGAMGGVVHVLTRDPLLASTEATAWDGQVAAGLTTADRSPHGAAELRVGTEQVGLLVGVSAARMGTLRVGGGALEPLSDLEERSVRTKLRIAPAAGHLVDLAWSGRAVLGAGRTDALAEGEVRFYDNVDQVGQLRYRYRGDGPLQAASAYVAAHAWSERQDRYGCETSAGGLVYRAGCLGRQPSAVTGSSERIDAVEAVLAGGLARWALWDDRLVLQTGADGQAEQVQSGRVDADPEGVEDIRSRGNFSPGSTSTTAGAYGWAEAEPVRLGRSALAVRGGVRWSHFGAQAEDVPQPNAAGEAEEQTVAYQWGGLVGSAGASLRIADQAQVFGGFHQGFRAPNLEETTIVGPEESRFSVPNPDLRPERSDTVELGVRADTGPVSGGVTGWRAVLTDALDDAPTTFGGQEQSADGLEYSRRVNVPGARHIGLEGDLAVVAGPVRVSGDAAWTRGEVDTEDGVAPARRVPPLFGGGAVRYTGGDARWFVEGAVRAAAAQTRLSSGDESDLRICAVEAERSITYADLGQACPGTPGWTRIDLRSRIALSDTLDLHLQVGNLLDARYRHHGSGIDAPGIDGRATLRARLGGRAE